MADPQGVVLGTPRHVAGCLVATARGEVTAATVTDLRHALDKLLAEGLPVLLDVSGLRLTWAPAPEVFPTAVTSSGGWPTARLVLFGADAAATERLVACRVAEAVPLAATAALAARLAGTRPARLACGHDFPGDEHAVRAARRFLRDTLGRWTLPGHPDAEVVVAELAANAVRHAGTPFRLRLVLDEKGLRISVRDRRPGIVPDVSGTEPQLPSGRGLRLVARLSRSWGVLHFADGKAVWAVLSSEPRTPGVITGRVRDAAALVDVEEKSTSGADEGRPTTVTAPRRQSYATADPEQAYHFLRGLYGEHTPHLSGTEDFPGFQLVYDGTSTNRFTVERLSHTMPFEGRFAPTAGLVVMQPVGGDLHVDAHAAHRRVDSGDAVLVDLGAGPRVSWTRLETDAVRLDPVAVARVAADLTGTDPAAVRFDLSRPVSPARAALWTATVRHLRDDLLPNAEAMASPLTRSAAFQHLVVALLEAFPNTALDALNRSEGGDRIAPASVRRAERYMEDHAGDDITLADVAAAARLGARGLQLAFRRHHDLTPLEYLRRVRLERAHRDLQAANPGDDTVGAIGSRWGFTHHGNFSAAYLKAYGHSPSITLRS